MLAWVPLLMAAAWQPGQSPLTTRWAEDVTPETVHPEYPRPQLVREGWQNLNGLWELAFQPELSQTRPETFDRTILVPFPVESALSGVMESASGQRLWHRRTFTVPAEWTGQVLLHFGAVDWDATVFLNGTELGRHRGGYDPFSFDVTDVLTGSGPQELVVNVWDPSDAWTQPRGKQVRNPEGIWYTPSSGIWGTVWLEPVPATYLGSLKLGSDIDAGTLSVAATVQGEPGGQGQLEVTVRDGETTVAELSGPAGEALNIPVPDAKLWSPESPFLYDLEVRLTHNGSVTDSVTSYAGMRKISLGQDERGVTRLFLNNEPLFHFGLLDQGFWPDGLYTAPTDAALRYDLEVTQELGFNTVRKHVKIEPERWYYHADRMGLLVWQDMPNGDAHVAPEEGEIERTPESVEQFELELAEMLGTLGNHPSIVMWVLFNEGWGQFETARLSSWLAERDPTRLLNSVSGWNDVGVGDVHDLHNYPDPIVPPQEADRAAVLGEFGGLGLPLAGNSWQDEANWGYEAYESREALLEALTTSLERLRELRLNEGLAAAIYTQTTDVETEVNGLLTYDRAIVKLDAARVRALVETFYEGDSPE